MLVRNEQYLLTPFVDLGVSDSDRREMLLGITLQQMVEGTTSLDVNLALGRVEERTGASSGQDRLERSTALLGRLRHAAVLIRSPHVSSPAPALLGVSGFFIYGELVCLFRPIVDHIDSDGDSYTFFL